MRITIELDGVGELFELKRLLSVIPIQRSVPVSQLGLRQRTVDALKEEGITETAHLYGMTDQNLLMLRPITRKDVIDIRAALKARGLEG